MRKSGVLQWGIHGASTQVSSVIQMGDIRLVLGKRAVVSNLGHGNRSWVFHLSVYRESCRIAACKLDRQCVLSVSIMARCKKKGIWVGSIDHSTSYLLCIFSPSLLSRHPIKSKTSVHR
jgi:hypothetical protein